MAVVVNDVTWAESADHGPYRQVHTPMIIPMMSMQDVHISDLHEQHDDEDDFDLAGGCSSCSKSCSKLRCCDAFLLLLLLLLLQA